ncbi:MAG: hypothetical protein M1147_08450 [Nitrospirae bacterium]|nr:hypothetical protein [Nitrospirota bacterium]MCL5978129.1 hypothetical protein [Nitrospirota bacterium]
MSKGFFSTSHIPELARAWKVWRKRLYRRNIQHAYAFPSSASVLSY